eukprot:TRINITY_DN95094_c0_g1_i1.p1 TRINITY_DN95094_c0_g1~~TRINITY_DN95094_c0_g1_i1.p1  ORF type:complete len:303 (+),score=40.67 TRINITY_DN95094_c0_g1_i1:27-911(+)
MASPEVLRVSQMDAQFLDNEVFDVLRIQLGKAFAGLPDSLGITARFAPEIEALVGTILLSCSRLLGEHPASYGERLHNLAARDESLVGEDNGALIVSLATRVSRRKGLYFVAALVLWRYVHARLQRASVEHGWEELPPETPRKRLWLFLTALEPYIKLATFVNFVIFLFNGKYRSLFERIVALRLVYGKPGSFPRFVNFEFMNRNIVWQALADFCAFLSKYINFSRFWRRRRITAPGQAGCSVCGAQPIAVECRSDCGHPFCYFCIAAQLRLNPHFRCPACRLQITTFGRAPAQ